MTFRDAIEGGAQSVVNWVVAGVLGGAFWLVRRVFTNEAQIKALQSEIKHRDERRTHDMDEFRTAIQRVEDAQRETREDIKKLFQR